MRAYLWPLGVSVLGVALAIYLKRRTPNTISKSWRKDHQRRSFGEGIDGVNWRWPTIWNGAVWVRRKR